MSTNGKPSGLKLRIGSFGPKPVPAPTAPAPDPVQTPGGRLKLNLGRASISSTPVIEEPAAIDAAPKKGKRKYIRKPKPENGVPPTAPKPSKKRAREDEENAPAKRQKDAAPPVNPIRLSLSTHREPAPAPASSVPHPSIPKLKLKNRQDSTSRIKIKHVGRPPHRPVGVGYDSEAEDVEVDPAIEHQFILRMTPGDDCDYLRRAIEEKKLGVPVKEGGADVQMRFFDKDGRRAMVMVRSHMYAATLVDLPCIIEGMKSWDKRGWWKGGDICQMLLVLGPVTNEDEAKNYPLPREVNAKTWQYAHGLTPPMHWVRQRRFRKRANRHLIESLEGEVERLLAADEQARSSGGSTIYKILDLGRDQDGASQVGTEDEDEPEADGYGALREQDGYYDEEEDDEAMARLMEEELGGDDEPDTAITPATAVSKTNDTHPSHQQASTPTANGAPTASTDTTSAAATETEEESDEDEELDEDDDGAVDEVDEEALAQQQELAQQREEIADLEREVEIARQQMEKQPNALLRQRLANKVMSLQSDLDLKKASLGTGWD